MPKLTPNKIANALLIATIVLWLLPILFGVRFLNPFYNLCYAMFIAFISPFILLFKSLVLERRWKKIIGALISLIVALPCALFLFFESYTAFDIHDSGKDPGFELIQEVSKDKYNYRLYRTNGGATTSFGLDLRKERNVGMGIKTTHSIHGKYPASDGKMEIRDEKILILTIEPYLKGKPEEVTFQL